MRNGKSKTYLRTAKALAIAAHINSFCAEQAGLLGDRPEYWHEDNEYQLMMQRFLKAAEQPFRPESRLVLEPHLKYTREWPSKETFDAVAAALERYTIFDERNPYVPMPKGR